MILTFERIRIFSRYLFVYILFSMKKDSQGNRYFLRRDQFKLTIITAWLFYVFVLSLIFMFPINPTENEKWILGFVLISIGFLINVIQKALNKILNDWELIVLSSFWIFGIILIYALSRFWFIQEFISENKIALLTSPIFWICYTYLLFKLLKSMNKEKSDYL